MAFRRRGRRRSFSRRRRMRGRRPVRRSRIGIRF